MPRSSAASGGASPLREPALGAPPHAVEHARRPRPAAAPVGARPGRRVDRRVGVAAALVARPRDARAAPTRRRVDRSTMSRRPRGHRTPPDVRAQRGTRMAGRGARPARPRPGRRAAGRARPPGRRRARGPARARPRGSRPSARRSARARPRRARAGARRRAATPREHGRRGEHAPAADAPRARRAATAGAARRRPPRRRSPSSSPATSAREDEVPRMLADGGERAAVAPTRPQTRTCSRSAARRFSPMPGIWSSSSTEPKPPCSVAVVEDLLGRGRADAVERVELLERRGVEVDRLAGAAGGRRGRAGAAAPARCARGPGRGSGGRPRASRRG